MQKVMRKLLEKHNINSPLKKLTKLCALSIVSIEVQKNISKQILEEINNTEKALSQLKGGQ